MPSTRRQKAKARKSREMDMMSDFENMDIMIGNGESNPIEREIASLIEESSVLGDVESSMYSRNDFRETSNEINAPRQKEARDYMESFSNENSMMAMMHSQIIRAICLAVSDRVITEIKNIMSSMSSSRNRDTEASSSPNRQENRKNNPVFKTKFPKKDSRSAGDLRNTDDLGPYNRIKRRQKCSSMSS